MTQFNPDTVELPSGIPSYVASIIRTVLGMGAGWLIAKGYFTADQAPQIIAGFLALGTVVWGLVQKVNANKKLKAAIVAPAGLAK